MKDNGKGCPYNTRFEWVF